MRYSSALVAALAAGASATAPIDARAKMYTLEFAPGDVRVVTEDEKFELRDAGAHFFDIVRLVHQTVRARPTTLTMRAPDRV